ncbi:MAG: regulatory protein RecX [Lachnospiraceae bacterium]
MIVTKMEEYKKNKYKIYLNDEFAFVLYKGELRLFKVKEGEALLQETYREILDTVLTKRAKLRAMYLLKTIDRTEADVRRKLKEGLYPQTVIDAAISYVKSYHYIDDTRYTENYIAYKTGSLSRSEIRQKLLLKGIDKELIEDQLAEHWKDGGETERELIRRLMLKKCRELPLSDYQEKNKLFVYLYRKGFTIGDIENVYKEFI